MSFTKLIGGCAIGVLIIAITTWICYLVCPASMHVQVANSNILQHVITPEYYLDMRTQTCFAYFPGSWTEVTCTKEVLDLIK